MWQSKFTWAATILRVTDLSELSVQRWPSSLPQTNSEQLQLLHELHPAVGLHTDKNTRPVDTNTDLRILDAIAIALTTGEPGEVVAAAFDRSEQLSLVLAMNRPPTREDEDATARLIATITDPATLTASDVFPFLLSRCLANINKRIGDLHQALSDFLPDLHSALPHYTPGSVEKELPHSAIYRERKFNGDEPEFSAIISKLVFHLSYASNSPLDPDDVDTSTIRYLLLDNLANILLRSPFLKLLCKDRNPSNFARRERAERLKRRLAKVCQYFGGVTQLVQMAKRWFPDGRIPYRWVGDTFVGSGEGQVRLYDDYVDAMQRACGAQAPPSPGALRKLATNFPKMRSNWEDRRIVKTCIHAEIRIILHFSKPLSSSLSSSHTDLRQPPHKPDRHAIGCSKRSCLCCTLWIDEYNARFETGWLTSGSHGSPCATWALPGDAATHGAGVDEAVVREVQTRLANALSWLYLDSKRMYDELVSSDDESSGSKPSLKEVNKKMILAGFALLP